jgi:hypothetical protein
MSLRRRSLCLMKLPPRLPWSSHVRRDRSGWLSLRPSGLRHQRRRLRPVTRNREFRDVVAAVEVAADLVRR